MPTSIVFAGVIATRRGVYVLIAALRRRGLLVQSGEAGRLASVIEPPYRTVPTTARGTAG